ncbi:MAG: hypothetical protein SGI91_13920 [Alphaproteobacteria bacterium]|jgi:hypothetical protein|nr:hypothetical protein [Alphaproteobacteria bacterium]
MGKRSKTAGETLPAEKLTLADLDRHIAMLELRYQSKINASLRKSAFKYLVWLEAERERIHNIPAPSRRFPR